MSSDFIKRPRREPMSLQLTAMIDIFSMIVIFLVLGTTASTDLLMPKNFILPKSSSKEISDSAPQVSIALDKVEFKALKLEFPLDYFTKAAQDPSSTEFTDLKSKVEAYTKTLAPSTTGAGILLNVLADERLPYKNMFDVVSVFRKSGFETLLFVTAPKPLEPGETKEATK